MDIDTIEQLVSIIRDARISELAVSTDSPRPTKIRLRKPLHATVAVPEPVTPRTAAQPAVEPKSVEEPAASEVYITAPMVGIFHSIDSISAVGAPVKAGQVVGAIESMKLMNDVVSEQDGVIVQILVEDGMPVEYGQSLFRLE